MLVHCTLHSQHRLNQHHIKWKRAYEYAHCELQFAGTSFSSLLCEAEKTFFELDIVRRVPARWQRQTLHSAQVSHCTSQGSEKLLV